MVVLQQQQIILLKLKINNIISFLEKYDLNKTAKFLSVLQIIRHNINQCIMSNFDGTEDLSKYVFEDWHIVCMGKSGIENWYIESEDVNLMRKLNEDFEGIVHSVDEILKTNFFIPRKWYSYNELADMGKKFQERKNKWNDVIQELRRTHRYYEVSMKQIPNDIWSFAKMLCIAETEDCLIEWFFSNVQAFGYLSPCKILQMENGDDILRNFMFDIPI